MKVYKVVERRRDGKLASLIVMGKAEKVYIPNAIHRASTWLARQGYYITAFDKCKHARAFGSRYGGKVELWECEATGITRYNHLPLLCMLFNLCHGALIVSPMKWPEGTIMCKTIKLIKEVT